jgi:hypothetical protein
MLPHREVHQKVPVFLLLTCTKLCSHSLTLNVLNLPLQTQSAPTLQRHATGLSGKDIIRHTSSTSLLLEFVKVTTYQLIFNLSRRGIGTHIGLLRGLCL